MLLLLFCCIPLLLPRLPTDYQPKKKKKTLSNILQTAYDENSDSPPNILLLSKPSLLTDPQNAPQPSHPPIADFPSDNYPFLARSVQDLANLLSESDPEPAISSHQFLVADEQTNEDNTLIFVDRGYDEDNAAKPETVRLDAAHANTIPISVQVATLDLEGVRSLVDVDGVYRGGSSSSGGGRPEPKKGKPAPRKRLGGGGPRE